jgi:hypothetical protein
MGIRTLIAATHGALQAIPTMATALLHTVTQTIRMDIHRATIRTTRITTRTQTTITMGTRLLVTTLNTHRLHTAISISTSTATN